MQPEADRKGPAVKFPPPLITLVVILSAYGLQRLVPMDISESSILMPPGIAMIVAALIIIAISAISFIRAKTHLEPWKPTSAIVSSGIFSLSRNPIYVGLCISCIGVGLVLNSWWIVFSFIPLAWLLFVLVIRREEDYLQGKFGEEYLSYQQRVRRWF
jgi:protein-S-isoprenylcysteine O-methyltransferase Ste14